MEDKVTRLEFNTMEGTTSNMTINGVPLNSKVIIEVCSCGNCKNVITQFQPNQPLKSRMEYINTEIKQQLIYCPKCGYKIDYGGCEIIDAEVVDVTNK